MLASLIPIQFLGPAPKGMNRKGSSVDGSQFLEENLKILKKTFNDVFSDGKRDISDAEHSNYYNNGDSEVEEEVMIVLLSIQLL